MGGKKGTLLGRALTSLIPESSPFHMVAEAVDRTIESAVFDRDKNEEVPTKNHSDVKRFITGQKNFLLALAEKGVITINWPDVEGENEEKVEQGLMLILEAYVNENT